MAIGVDIGAHGATTCDDARRATRHPVDPARRRVVNDLTTRIGDPVPMIFWDHAHRVQHIAPHELYAGEVMRVLLSLGHDTARGNGRGIAIAVPAWWTTRATAMVRDSLHAALGPRVVVVSDAVAAVRGLRADGVRTDDVMAVLDVGARTTSAAVVARCSTSRPEVVGRPTVHVDGAGDEVDVRLLHHVLDAVHGPNDRSAVSGQVARDLLDRCHDAKHALSTRSATTFTTGLTSEDAPVRLIRDELDEIALPWARTAAQVLASAIDSTGSPVRSVLVVGGGAHVPLVSQIVSAELGLEVLTVDEPSSLLARGAQTVVAGIDHTRSGVIQRLRSRLPHPRGRSSRHAARRAITSQVALAIEAAPPPTAGTSRPPVTELESHAS